MPDKYDNCHFPREEHYPYIRAMGQTFPKKERLKSRKILESLMQKGQSVRSYPLKLIYLPAELPENVPVQAAMAVGKRQFKSAVKRNRIKRLLREAYRLNKGPIFNNIERNYAFLILYIGSDLPSFDMVNQAMTKLLQKFMRHEIES